METLELTLPSHWAAALINDDYSGMTDEEITELESWQDNNTHNPPVYRSEEEEFHYWHDARSSGVLPTSCLVYTFIAHSDDEGYLCLD